MEIGAAQLLWRARHTKSVLDRALIHAFARGEDAPIEIDDGSELERGKVGGCSGQAEADGVVSRTTPWCFRTRRSRSNDGSAHRGC